MADDAKTPDIQIPEGFKELLQEFTVAALKENPSDLLSYSIEYFTERKRQRDGAGEENKSMSEEDEDDDDDDDEPAPPPPTMKGRNRRVGVAAESYDPEKEEQNYQKVINPKTEEQRMRLNLAVKNILIFRCLDDDQMVDVIDAMFERKVQPGENVIEQGEDGDNFYVIESGVYHIYVLINGTKTKVGQYDNTGSFGELALMYNCPRAATIEAATDGVLWAMDRETFRCIVLKKAFQKRMVYETLLESVPMLKDLNTYERMSIADALRTVIFQPGEKNPKSRR